MKRIGIVIVALALFSAVEVCGFENKDKLVAGITFIDRSTGQNTEIYELTGVFKRDENIRYILGMEIREDVLKQRFGRFGLTYTNRIRENKEASLEVDYWPGVDSNNDLWQIFLLNGEIKTDAGLLMGLSYKGFIIPGDDMGIASLKGGYFNKAVLITGEFIHSLDWSPVTVSSFVAKMAYFTGRASFTIGGSVGRTYLSYAQLQNVRDTHEEFASVSYTLNNGAAFSIIVGKSRQEGLRQDSYTATVNYGF